MVTAQADSSATLTHATNQGSRPGASRQDYSQLQERTPLSAGSRR